MFELDRTLFLKIMLDIVMDIDDRTLQALAHSLHALRIKDIPGENVRTAVSCLKGVLLLPHKCTGMPTDDMGLPNHTMGSADCDDFTCFMYSVYFGYK